MPHKRPTCDECKTPLRDDPDTDGYIDGEPTGWGDPYTARAHLCAACWHKIFDQAWKDRDPCASCETQPCERGRDCWFEPSLPYPYETYVAPAIQTTSRAAEAAGGDE